MDQLKKVAVACFCLFHLLAIGFYGLPDTLAAKLSPLDHWKQELRDWYRPYTLITSQWQSWPLFAPDPLRRVITFEVQTKNDNEIWETLFERTPQNIAWWRKSAELKTMRRLTKKSGGELTRIPLLERYLHLACQKHQLATGTKTRLQVNYFVIPRNKEVMGGGWWQSWEPEWKQYTATQTACLKHKV